MCREIKQAYHPAVPERSQSASRYVSASIEIRLIHRQTSLIKSISLTLIKSRMLRTPKIVLGQARSHLLDKNKRHVLYDPMLLKEKGVSDTFTAQVSGYISQQEYLFDGRHFLRIEIETADPPSATLDLCFDWDNLNRHQP
ncbi:MAG: hypothetical protein DMF61_12665 [Blastocatellia bacterium AA13]|nr:MAG: hypothetical protein DMF61_12665 [Blastocatellia bacterium AA13]